MVETEDARNFPGSVVVVPEMNEAAFAVGDGRFDVGVSETVDAYFDGAEVVDAEDFERAGNELALGLAADILLDAVHEGWPAESDAASVVIELDILVDERAELVEVAFVVRVEECGVLRLDDSEEFRIGGWLDGLCVRSSYQENGQR